MKADSGFSFWTHMELGRRRTQEDAFAIFVGNGRSLFAISDGMGGYGSGDIASTAVLAGMQDHIEAIERAAADDMAGVLTEDKEPAGACQFFVSDRDMIDFAPVDAALELSRAARRGECITPLLAQHILISAAEAGIRNLRRHPQTEINPNMGCTLSAVWCYGPGVAAWVHVGDSRIYRLPHDKDQALQINKNQAHDPPHQNVLTRAVSARGKTIIWDEESAGHLAYESGDVLVLCTDGVHGLIDPHRFVAMDKIKDKGWEHFHDLAPGQFLGNYIRSGPIEFAARGIVQYAIDKGGTDNATAIVVVVP